MDEFARHTTPHDVVRCRVTSVGQRRDDRQHGPQAFAAGDEQVASKFGEVGIGRSNRLAEGSLDPAPIVGGGRQLEQG